MSLSISNSKHWVIGVVCAIFMVLVSHLLFFEWFARDFIQPEHVLYRQEKAFWDRMEDLKVLALGDSHMQSGLNIASDQFVNFATGSDTLPVMYFKLKKAVANSEALNTVIMQAEYHSFSVQQVQYKHLDQYKDYVDEKVPAELGDYPSPGSVVSPFYSLSENVSPILYEQLVEVFVPNPKRHKYEVLANGYAGLQQQWVQKPASERVTAATLRATRQLESDYYFNRQLARYYDKIIKLAQENDVQVVLLRLPLSNEYLAAIRPDIEQDMAAYYRQLAKKYGLKLLDMRHIFKDQQELFQDMDHLTVEGGTELGKMVASRLGL